MISIIIRSLILIILIDFKLYQFLII